MILQDSWAITHDNLENEIMQNQSKSKIFDDLSLKSEQIKAFGVSFARFEILMRLNEN